MDNIIIKKINKTADPNYFKNYYHSSSLSDKIPCLKCSRILTKQKMKRHQASPRCKVIELNTMINLLDDSPTIN